MKSMLHLVLSLAVLTSCTFKQQEEKAPVKTINGMDFMSMTLPNELEVLLVSDSRFKKSSAAMAVMVGSLEDPVEAQGLAHYLEHMLFLGTKDFPKSDEYSTFMEHNGGWDNAYTSDEVTNYMFEVDHAAIEGALHRFSRFFVSPLFDANYLQREKNAVNSEFEKNIKDDNWRMDRYVSQLSKDKHPYKKFSTGNTQTLAAADRPAVINFYRQYYSSNNMKLVIMSAEPLNKLKQWTEKYFGDVPNFNARKPEYESFFFSPKDNERLHFVKTIDDVDELAVLFNIEDEKLYWKTKPLKILGRLLGDEGKGSLLSYLKQKGWALGVMAGESYWNTFEIKVTLTPEGRKSYQEVVAAIFSYIDLIQKKGYPKYLFEDESALSKVDLDNLEPSASGGRAASFARAMTDYPVNEFLERNYLLETYSTEDFQKFLNFFNIKNAHIIVASRGEKTNKKESIFGIEYSKEPLSPAFLTKLQTPLVDVFSYPEKNKYVPTDFSLVTKKVQGPAEKIDLGDSQVLYMQQDTELGFARSLINVRFISSVENTPKTYLLNYLFTVCKAEELKEWSYPITEARVDFGLYTAWGDTMVFNAGGYSHRLMQTVNDLVLDKENNRRLDQCVIDQSLFSKIKDKVKKEIQNKEQDVAYQRLGEEMAFFSTDKSIHWKEILPMIDGVTLKDVQAFGSQFFKKGAIEVLAYGNVKPEEIKILPQSLAQSLGITPLEKPEWEKKERRFRVAPEGQQYSMVIKGQNNNYAMSSIYNMGAWNLVDHAKIVLLGQMVAQPYFSELRTNQQLGYVARSSATFNKGFVGLTATLQSPKYPSLELQQKSQEFLDGLLKKMMETLTDAEIQPVKSAMINELLNKPNTLGERFTQFRDSIYNYDGQFDIRKNMAEELKKITAEDIKKLIREKYFARKPSTVNFFYYGTGSKVPKKGLPGKTFEKVSDVKDWIYVDPYKKAK